MTILCPQLLLNATFFPTPLHPTPPHPTQSVKLNRGKPGPRVADLSQSMDSRFLMRQAVDLNLRLMKWRVWPQLDTDLLASTRCLLLGAGTLGCAVARSLLGWGVRHITLVDSGRVSYSNPARQCLFEFADCEQRRFKAEAAADRLKCIFPDVQSEGVVLSIAMPGHPLVSTPAVATSTSEAGGKGPHINSTTLVLICLHM